MNNKTAAFFHTRLKLSAFGAWPESLINLALSAGLEISGVNRTGSNTIEFEIYEMDLPTVQQLSNKCGVELDIFCYSEGLCKTLRRCIVLLPLFLTAISLLFISSLFVWQIEIHGNHSLSRGEILRALEDSGLYHGCFWPGIKADDVRSNLMLKLPEIAWMTVNTSGSRALVLINERVDKPQIYEESAAADLVASKSGLIRRVSVLQGAALVEPGQAVLEGEILATGNLQSLMGSGSAVRAKGTVMADTWYEINALCPEEMAVKQSLGLARHRFALVFGKRRINLYFSSGKAIDECDKIIREYTLGLEGHFATPVRLVHERVTAYKSAPGQAYDRDAMARRLNALLDATHKGQILQSAFTESSVEGLYMLTLRAHYVENIALTQEIQ